MSMGGELDFRCSRHGLPYRTHYIRGCDRCDDFVNAAGWRVVRGNPNRGARTNKGGYRPPRIRWDVFAPNGHHVTAEPSFFDAAKEAWLAQTTRRTR